MVILNPKVAPHSYSPLLMYTWQTQVCAHNMCHSCIVPVQKVSFAIAHITCREHAGYHSNTLQTYTVHSFALIIRNLYRLWYKYIIYIYIYIYIYTYIYIYI